MKVSISDAGGWGSLPCVSDHMWEETGSGMRVMNGVREPLFLGTNPGSAT